MIQETFQYWLTDTCQDLDKAKRKEMTAIILGKMATTDICKVETINNICSSESVAVICEKKKSSIMRGRNKRTTDHLNLAIQLTLSFSIQ
jgi:hypothetical protein